jgi:hypothetical protein
VPSAAHPTNLEGFARIVPLYTVAIGADILLMIETTRSHDSRIGTLIPAILRGICHLPGPYGPIVIRSQSQNLSAIQPCPRFSRDGTEDLRLELCAPVRHDHDMQTRAGINWSQVIGIVCGAGLVFAIFMIFAWNRRHQKALLKERPPQSAKLRRPAGYALQCRIDELSEQLLLSLLQSVGSGSVLGLLCASFYPLMEGLILRRFTIAEIRNQPHSYILVSAAALAMTATAWLIKSVIQAFSLQTKIRNCRFGLRGEQAVAEALNDSELAAAGYVAFHDVPGDGPWNIDHVVIGPGGVFVLETKTRSRRQSKRQQADHEVLFDGRTLQFPWCNDQKAVTQVSSNAEWVRRFIDGFGPKKIPVNPIIIVPGWYARTEGKYEIKVMNAKYLASNFLPHVPRMFSPEDLKPLKRRFDERCRDLEF